MRVSLEEIYREALGLTLMQRHAIFENRFDELVELLDQRQKLLEAADGIIRQSSCARTPEALAVLTQLLVHDASNRMSVEAKHQEVLRQVSSLTRARTAFRGYVAAVTTAPEDRPASFIDRKS